MPSFMPLRVNGYNFHFQMRGVADFLVREIFAEEAYYAGELPAHPKIVDIGSNIGVSIHYFKHKYPDAEIVGYEPAPEVYSLLKKNIFYNGLKDVNVINAAVSGKAGTLPFYYSRDNNGSSSVYEPVDDLPRQKIEVPVIGVDDVITGHVDYLKVDAEGVEGEIFNQLFKSGKIGLVDRVAFEYHYAYLGNKPLVEILDGLVANGFDVRIRTPDINQYRNWIMCIMVYARRL
jgi:FkbM family methyltransferase